MTNREKVINLVKKLPEDMPLEEIAQQVQLIAGIEIGREQARRGEGIPAEEGLRLIRKTIAEMRASRTVLNPKGKPKLRIKDLINEGRR